MKYNIKTKLIAVTTALSMMAGMTGILSSDYTVNAATPKMSKKSISIVATKTVQLKVLNNSKKVKWSTSNKKIATVSKKGLVKGKKAGKATITAKVGKKKYKCTVNVKTGLNATQKSLKIGDTYTLKLLGNSKKVKWSSSKNSVVSVNSKGKIKALKEGKVTIMAKVGRSKYKCMVTVAKNNTTKSETTKLQPSTPTDTVKKEILTITGPTGTVRGYSDSVYSYLNAKDAYSPDYAEVITQGQVEKSQKDIDITWTCNIDGVTKYIVEYATKADYSDAIEVETTSEKVSLRNLYKATTYYTRVRAYVGDKQVKNATGTFNTTEDGPRLMTIDSLYNVRDIGGYMTESGKRTLQGLIFRGSEMESKEGHGINISEAGKKFMSEVLGIKHDMDLRAESSSTVTESPIPGASKIHYSIDGYTSAFTQKESYRKIFSALADEENYPVYIHCWGGADRTGTVCYLINALCGVDEKDLYCDYGLTSWSIFGYRDRDYDAYDFKKFEKRFKEFEGSTLSEKAKNYMLSIGVTETEIANIKAIMFGEPTQISATVQQTFDADTETKLDITISGKAVISKVTLNGSEVKYTKTSKGISVDKSNIPTEIKNNDVVSGVIFLENGNSVNFSFKYVQIAKLTDYMFSETGIITLNSEKTSVISDNVLGYGNQIRIDMKSTDAQPGIGGIYVTIGSYGILLRGGEVRIVSTTDGNIFKEVKRYTGMSFESDGYEGNGGYLIISVNISGETPVLYVKGVGENWKREYTYTFEEEDKLSESEEIKSENAKISIGIHSGAMTKLDITTGKKQR